MEVFPPLSQACSTALTLLAAGLLEIEGPPDPLPPSPLPCVSLDPLRVGRQRIRSPGADEAQFLTARPWQGGALRGGAQGVPGSRPFSIPLDHFSGFLQQLRRRYWQQIPGQDLEKQSPRLRGIWGLATEASTRRGSAFPT